MNKEKAINKSKTLEKIFRFSVLLFFAIFILSNNSAFAEKEIGVSGQIKDAETGETMMVDTGNKNFRDTLKNYSEKKMRQLDVLFSKTGVDMVKVYTGQDYVQPLMNMFKKRESRK